MSGAKLLSVGLQRFKSFDQTTRVELAPLTIILGRNNSGKSSLIQALLLLKQTLAEPRSEVPLHLDGFVSAFSLRELTFGWPAAGDAVDGPTITVEWSSDVQFDQIHFMGRYPYPKADAELWERLTGRTGRTFLVKGAKTLTSRIELATREVAGTTSVTAIRLWSSESGDAPVFVLKLVGEAWTCWWGDTEVVHGEVNVDHFVPYLRANYSHRSGQIRHGLEPFNAWHALFAQPLESLKRLLAEFQYLGSTRSLPPSLYRASNVAPQDIGVSGELAAQLLHRRQRDVVHYLPPIEVKPDGVVVPNVVRERPLVDAVNDVLAGLAIETKVSVEEIREFGFRLLFGSASLQHVGRGLTYLLPLVELGLFAEPLRFVSLGGDLPLEDYAARCNGFAHLAIEEPEAHLHPKVQSRLAQWLVSLAMSNRRVMVETHSDHLVRRLRGLIARAEVGSDLERWLLENVVILEVEQDEHGRSTVQSTRLTRDGRLGERWPADFMDEASEEDSAIYFAGLAKEPVPEHEGATFVHDDGPEPEDAT